MIFFKFIFNKSGLPPNHENLDTIRENQGEMIDLVKNQEIF